MTTAYTTGVSLPLAPGRWAVDPHQSFIGFSFRHLGISRVRGRFTRFEVEVVIGETLDTSTVIATVDMASIDTANADRDANVLLPGNIIDVAKRPTMVFHSTRITGAGSEYRVDGELTVLAVEFGGIETFPGPGSSLHAGFAGTMEVRRKDFGIDVQLPPGVSAVMLGEVVKVDIDLQLIEPAS
jgi:polyisoprenoid-binding protein YceI